MICSIILLYNNRGDNRWRIANAKKQKTASVTNVIAKTVIAKSFGGLNPLIFYAQFSREEGIADDY